MPAPPVQLVAYNKVDLPDSGDYWEFVKDYLVEVSHRPRASPVCVWGG